MADSPGPTGPASQPVAGVTSRGRTSFSAWLAARIDLVLRLGLFLIIVIEAVVFTIKTIPSGSISDIGTSTFISVGNLQDIGRQMAVIGVLALGETFVIITAGIDLSVGSTIGITGVICGEAMTNGWPAALVIVMVLLFGVGIGLVNGTLVGVAKVPPFIVTLGMLGILRGAAYLVTGGINLALSPTGAPTPFTDWVETTNLGVPNIFAVLRRAGHRRRLFLALHAPRPLYLRPGQQPRIGTGEPASM